MPLRFWYVVVGGLPLAVLLGLGAREIFHSEPPPEPPWHGVVKPSLRDARTWKYFGPFDSASECSAEIERVMFNMDPAAEFFGDCGTRCSKEPNGHLLCEYTRPVSSR